ncbi:MAG: DUF4435 domain-containing protein [Verrucomicrobiota bacterium]
MINTEQHSIPELVARYELEPELRDIFVEGEHDQNFIRWLLDESGCSDAAVYTISCVDISDGDVLASGFEANNKGRVIQLAKTLSQLIDPKKKQITCIADQDFDLILERKHSIPCLLVTDYTCMEMYLMNEKTINKFLSVGLKGFPYSSQMTLCILAPPLQELFLIRLANHVLNLGLEQMPFKKCCSFKNDRIIFDAEEFTKRYLHKNGKYNELYRFKQTIQTFRKKLRADCPRCQINGHDFLCMLAWLIKVLKKGTPVKDSEITSRILAGCLEYQTLKHEPLFISLKARLEC